MYLKIILISIEKKLADKNSIERELEMKKLELQKAQVYIKNLEFQRDSVKEYKDLVKNQQHKLSMYGELEKENAKLKEDTKKLRNEVQNKLLLEEEVYDLKTRLAKYQEQEKKFNELQMTQVQSEMYLDEWRSVARGICETDASDIALPRLVRGVVERLQHQEITLTSEKVQLESQLSSALHVSNNP